MVLIRSALLSMLLAFSTGFSAYAGRLIFDANDPKWAVFLGPIKITEIDHILSQLEEKKPAVLALHSYGGDVAAALKLASHVHKNKIKTFVAELSFCASACSLVFMGGAERLAEGILSVHQARPIEENQETLVRQDIAWSAIQSLMAERIRLLNSFDTPVFFYEQMLDNYNSYKFTAKELEQLNTVKTLDELYPINELQKIDNKGVKDIADEPKPFAGQQKLISPS